jgi:2-amino-4-hydroxy-6-hydroxymethyldihydropteridine diphosphokinase
LRIDADLMILIGVGANLPGPAGQSPFETCNEAVQVISKLPGLKTAAVSPWYRTAPVPRNAQPYFCNGIARMEGTMDPLTLLGELQKIEVQFGRKRGDHNAPRTLDLDIIDLNGIIRALPPLTLPHPRAHLRAFVLRPLMDVAPAWRHPTLRRGVASLLADLPPQGIDPWKS